jgi:hypothetical protein
MASGKFPDWYCTRNLWVAAFLVASGNPLPRLDGRRGRAEFWFSDPAGEVSWQAMKFDADEPVGIRTFSAAMRTLREALDDTFGKSK